MKYDYWLQEVHVKDPSILVDDEKHLNMIMLLHKAEAGTDYDLNRKKYGLIHSILLDHEKAYSIEEMDNAFDFHTPVWISEKGMVVLNKLYFVMVVDGNNHIVTVFDDESSEMRKIETYVLKDSPKRREVDDVYYSYPYGTTLRSLPALVNGMTVNNNYLIMVDDGKITSSTNIESMESCLLPEDEIAILDSIMVRDLEDIGDRPIRVQMSQFNYLVVEPVMSTHTGNCLFKFYNNPYPH